MGRYSNLIRQTDLSRRQKITYIKKFNLFADHVEKKLVQEQTARQNGESHANVPYHATHMLQAGFDGINVAAGFLEYDLVPEIAAYETPGNAVTHDLEYFREVNEKYPTFAHNIVIHVPASIGKKVALTRQFGFPDFYSDQDQALSLYTTALEIHGTHFASKDEMEFHLANRKRMIEKFAARFSCLKQYDLEEVGKLLTEGSRIWDLWGQLLPPDYRRRLPLLQGEMNAATPVGEKPKGDLIIGTTPEEQTANLSGFVKYAVLDEPTIETANKIFGSNNKYETGLRQLIVTEEKAA